MTDYVHKLPFPPLNGQVITVNGFVPAGNKRFHISLSCAPTFAGGDIALHYNPSFDENCVVRNSYVRGKWQEEERGGPFPFKRDSNFQCDIRIDGDEFKLGYNGEYLWTYRQRIPLTDVTHVIIGSEGSTVDVHSVN